MTAIFIKTYLFSLLQNYDKSFTKDCRFIMFTREKSKNIAQTPPSIRFWDDKPLFVIKIIYLHIIHTFQLTGKPRL